MLDHVIFAYGMNLNSAESLVKDLSPEQMVQQPNGVINHAAWSLGHLAVVSNSLAKTLGLESTLPEGWGAPFATGGVPSADQSAYPSKDEIVDALKAQHVRVTEAIKNVDPATLAQPHPNEKMRGHFPTVGDYAIFLMTSHEAGHIGQLAAWRRALGLGSKG